MLVYKFMIGPFFWGNGSNAVFLIGEFMEYIKKEDLLHIFERLLESRANKNCSKQVIIERQIYQYVVNIIKTLPTTRIDG